LLFWHFEAALFEFATSKIFNDFTKIDIREKAKLIALMANLEDKRTVFTLAGILFSN